MSKFQIINGLVYLDGQLKAADITVDEGIISGIHIQGTNEEKDAIQCPKYDAKGLVVFPGFVDIHVHFREPGFEEKETILTGTMAAAHGGYTSVCTMPNLNPIPDSLETLNIEREKIKETALVHVFPYGAITVNEKGTALSNMEEMASFVVAFSDDGVGVQSRDMMKEAMIEAKRLGKSIVAHAEEIELVNGGVIHDGEYAKKHNHKGNPSASEWKQVERDIDLARETGASYHVCHVSTKESIGLVAKAQEEGLNVTCETAPHYLVFNDSMLQEDGRFRMNPPIRAKEDQEALIHALKAGNIVAIATDHAPHTREQKAGGLDHSLNGIVGLETAFPACYTYLVKTGIISLQTLVDRLTVYPIERLKLNEVIEAKESKGVAKKIAVGEPCDITLFDLDNPYVIDAEEFLSKGKSSPFLGHKVYGKCIMTMVGGEIAYQDKERISCRK